MSLLETAIERLGGKCRWKDASGGVAEIPIPGQCLQVFSFNRAQANDRAFVDRKLRLLGFGDPLPHARTGDSI